MERKWHKSKGEACCELILDMGNTFSGPCLGLFSQHRSIFPSEENVASRKFSLSKTTYYETNPARSNFLDAA